MRFYFDSLMGGDDTAEANYVRPNVNCNRSSWIDGCEPGWACSAGADQKINLQDTKNMPYRPLKCQSCCPGFFCPHGLTCMIRKKANNQQRLAALAWHGIALHLNQ
jgi:hypothetical protein